MKKNYLEGYERVPRCLFCNGENHESRFELTRNTVNGDRFASCKYDSIASKLYIKRCLDCGLEFQGPRPTEEVLLSIVDAVVSLDRFEHLHSPRKFLAEVRKRLKPGGILYKSIENR